jgi:hypothetical protein
MNIFYIYIDNFIKFLNLTEYNNLLLLSRDINNNFKHITDNELNNLYKIELNTIYPSFILDKINCKKLYFLKTININKSNISLNDFNSNNNVIHGLLNNSKHFISFKYTKDNRINIITYYKGTVLKYYINHKIYNKNNLLCDIYFPNNIEYINLEEYFNLDSSIF